VSRVGKRNEPPEAKFLKPHRERNEYEGPTGPSLYQPRPAEPATEKTMSTLNAWDRISPANTAQIAAHIAHIDGTGTSQEDRIAVVTMMSSRFKWASTSRWDSGGTDNAPWHMVGCATRGWGSLGDLLRGDAFLGCLARSLDLAGSGWSGMGVSPRWDATPAEIISATRDHFISSNEDGLISEEDEAILSLPPAMIAAVHLRMEAHFMERVREEPDLIMSGSLESIQRDIQKRWGKVVTAITESRREKAA
jgi:hypothetical protein